jgi:hypothetical protein
MFRRKRVIIRELSVPAELHYNFMVSSGYHYIIVIIIIIIIIIISGSVAQRGLWPPCLRGFVITHNNAPLSVGLLWTSDQLVAETST